MPESLILKSKVCLVGEKGVGKTSLVRRYVLDQFADTYVRTLGAKVTKKSVRFRAPEAKTSVDITMSIWDVMGHVGVRQLLGDSFFEGAQGILAVADLTRRDTLSALPAWIEAVQSVSGVVPVLLLGNKSDLEAEAQVGGPEVAQTATVLRCGHLLTSAKTGRNVEDAFLRLAGLIAKERVPGA
jgi:small GTP-binding protein